MIHERSEIYSGITRITTGIGIFAHLDELLHELVMNFLVHDERKWAMLSYHLIYMDKISWTPSKHSHIFGLPLDLYGQDFMDTQQTFSYFRITTYTTLVWGGRNHFRSHMK